MTRPTDWWVLDLGRDPTPGDPHQVRSLARRVRRVADDAERAARDVRGLASDGSVLSWIGLAGEVFRGALDDFPTQLDKLADSYSQCSSALAGFAAELDTAQDQADRALAQGREARADIASLQSQLGSARDAASAASSTAAGLNRPPAAGAEPPDPDQVRAATRNAQAAASRVSQLSGQLGGAQARLEAAKRLARDAEDLRNGAGDRAKARLHDASDAGIKPNSWWEDFTSGAAKVWKVTIQFAKIAVAVLGIVVLIIGGPLAWVVVGLSVLILADALMKVRSGEGSWLDVAVAALGLIPGVKGLTTLGAIKNAWAGSGRVLGVARHLGGAFKDLGAGGVRGAKSVWEGRRLLPILARQAPSAAAARVANMAADVRHGVPGALRGFSGGFGAGAGIVGRIRTGFAGAGSGFREGVETFTRTPAGAAYVSRKQQGSLPYLGVDPWRGELLERTRQVEAVFPKFSGFVAPKGTMAAVGHDSRAYNEALQISSFNGTYREYGVTFELMDDMSAGSAVTKNNPQFGHGGGQQHYIPDFTQRVNAGDIYVADDAGNKLPAMIDDDGHLHVRLVDDGPWVKLEGAAHAPSILTPLTNATPGPGVWSPEQIKEVVDGARNAIDSVKRPVGIITRAAKLVP